MLVQEEAIASWIGDMEDKKKVNKDLQALVKKLQEDLERVSYNNKQLHEDHERLSEENKTFLENIRDLTTTLNKNAEDLKDFRKVADDQLFLNEKEKKSMIDRFKLVQEELNQKKMADADFRKIIG